MAIIKSLIIISFLLSPAMAFLASCTTQKGWDHLTRASLRMEPSDIEMSARLKGHVERLATVIGERNEENSGSLDAAARYIAAEMEGAGYSLKERPYTYEGGEYRNLVFEKGGNKPGLPAVLLCAHYDTADTPGADDNASGIAVMIEVARRLSAMTNRAALRFVAFANEETPFYKTEGMGSLVYARELQKQGETIRAAIVLEMVGYYSEKSDSQDYPPPLGIVFPNRGNFVLVVGNGRYSGLEDEIARAFSKVSGVPVRPFSLSVRGVDFSDHWSFWQCGFPAVMVTDTAFYRNTNYHQASDTPGTLDYFSMAHVVRGITAAMLALANGN